MELERAKGTEDYPPEKKILRDNIVRTLIQVFERYGFDPLETPILERYETLSAKYAGGAEILKETFRLKDQGDRELGLRYDLTVPLARFIAMNPQISFPFKRYQIEKVFRDGPITKSRIREFWQCDVDIVGSKSYLADVEIIRLALDTLKELKLKCLVKINNRKLLNEIIEYAGVTTNTMPVILSIDKFYKIGKSGVEKELTEKGLDKKQINKIMSILSVNGSNDKKLKTIKNKIDKDGIAELEKVLKYFKQGVVFDPTLARGLSYYTGTIFEIVLEDQNLGCSVGGGGRYDNMIGSFSNNRDIPATGISFGLEPLTTALSKIEKEKKTVVDLFVIPIGYTEEALKITKKLREFNINTDIDLNERNVSKNLNYANNKGIPYVLFVGEQEVKKNKVKLRNMKTGKEQIVPMNKVPGILKRK